jgi:hypothetical protein
MTRALTRAAAAFWLLIPAFSASVVAGAQTVCLTVETEERKAVFEVAVGESLSLAFTHSIYDSRVEEQFRVGARGFHPVRVRYAEQRLVEFYGHESARRDGGWWVVDGTGAELAALELRASEDAFMLVLIGDRQISFGAHGRLSVSACPQQNHG